MQQSLENKLDQYGRKYPPKRGLYYTPGITVDALVFRQIIQNNMIPEILMVTRGNDPFKGFLALPGGFIDYNEKPEDSCLRELKEETNLIGKNVQLFTAKGDPNRDPRQHTISLIYIVDIEENQQPKGGDDAAHAEFYNLNEILESKNKIAFDHHEIISEFQQYLIKNNKIKSINSNSN